MKRAKKLGNYIDLCLTFKVHIAMSSSVTDHCRAYVLSYPNDPDHVSHCDHHYEDRCDRCYHLASVIEDIEEVLEAAQCSTESKDELVFLIAQAKQNISAWKSHLLHSTNQDECRLDILKQLDQTSALLVLDKAMKYLSRKF